MSTVKRLIEWLEGFKTYFFWALPLKIKAIFQAILVGLKTFYLGYKAVRKVQSDKIKREIKESATKIVNPSLTLEERLELNAQMESNFKHFVAGPDSK